MSDMNCRKWDQVTQECTQEMRPSQQCTTHVTHIVTTHVPHIVISHTRMHDKSWIVVVHCRALSSWTHIVILLPQDVGPTYSCPTYCGTWVMRGFTTSSYLHLRRQRNPVRGRFSSVYIRKWDIIWSWSSFECVGGARRTMYLNHVSIQCGTWVVVQVHLWGIIMSLISQ